MATTATTSRVRFFLASSVNPSTLRGGFFDPGKPIYLVWDKPWAIKVDSGTLRVDKNEEEGDSLLWTTPGMEMGINFYKVFIRPIKRLVIGLTVKSSQSIGSLK